MTRQRGFTLIEVLVALMLTAVLTVMAMDGLRLGQRVWEKTGAVRSEIDHAAVTRAFLRDRLAAAFPADPLDAESPGLTGTRDSISFVAPAPDVYAAAHPATLVRYDLRLNEASSLVLEMRDPFSGVTAGSTVMENVEGVEFLYLDSDGEDGSGRWLSEWRDRAVLPSLISLSVRSAGRAGQVWPRLIAHPLTDEPPGCVSGVGNGGCIGKMRVPLRYAVEE